MASTCTAGASASDASPQTTGKTPDGEKEEIVGGKRRQRATLACDQCRTRKARCDGVTPTCGGCASRSLQCDPPDPEMDGRKRRKERKSRSETAPVVVQAAQQKVEPPDDSSNRSLTSVPPHASTSLFSYSQPQGSPSLFARAEPQQPQQSGSFLPMLADIATSPQPPRYDTYTPFGAAEAAEGLETLANGNLMSGGSAYMAPPPAPPPAPPSDDSTLPRLVYFRPFGPTAIQPGLEQINLSIAAPPTISRAQSPTSFDSLNQLPSDFMSSFTDPRYGSPLNQHISQAPAFAPFAPPAHVDRFYEEGSDVPRPELQRHLFELFFRRLGSHFPFITRHSMEQLESASSPASVDMPLLINSICSLAARFSDNPTVKGSDPSRPPALYGVPFADRAKSMLIPLLAYPTTATVQSLLMLSWHEWACNGEGGLWAYFGMGMRMAQDLGLHLDIRRRQVDPMAQAVNRLTWWALVCTDRMLSIGTGRTCNIKSHEISVAFPTSEDIALVAGERSTSTDSPFRIYSMMQCCIGDMCDIINNVTEPWGAGASASSEPPSRGEEESANLRVPTHPQEGLKSISHLEHKFTSIYGELPPTLAWTAANFRRHHEAGTGPIFLHVHLWYHTILILLYRPPLVYPKCNAADLSLADRLAVVTSSCLAVANIIEICDLVDQSDYEAAPFVNTAFFVSSSAWIQDYRIRTGRSLLAAGASNSNSNSNISAPSNASTSLLAQVAVSNFKLCQSTMAKQARHWLGVGWIGALMAKQGAHTTRSSIKTATAGLHTFVSGPEMAVFRRLAQRISGGVRTPELDSEAVSALFTMLQTDSLAAQNYNLTPDDFALAYTFASTFPDVTLNPQL